MEVVTESSKIDNSSNSSTKEDNQKSGKKKLFKGSWSSWTWREYLILVVGGVAVVALAVGAGILISQCCMPILIPIS